MKLLFTCFILLVAFNNLMAQAIITVTQGTTKEYHIDAQSNITTYNWQVYDDYNLTTQTGSSDVTLASLGAGRENEIQVTWNSLGTYYLLISVTGTDGCVNTSAYTFNVVVNNLPVLADDSNSTTETIVVSETDGSGNILANDTDADNDLLFITAVNGDGTGNIAGTYGVLSWNSDGTYTYTPNSEMDTLYLGESVIETFTVTVSDGMGGVDNSTLSIIINGDNQAPIASNDTNITTETNVITSTDVNSSGILLGNDTDIDSDTLTVWQVEGSNSGTVVGTYGSLTWNSDGTYTYTPNSELDSLRNGENVVETFTYSCGDGKGGSDDALLTITINGQNADPVLTADTNSTIETNPVTENDGSGNLLANDSDIDGNELFIEQVNGNSSGSVTGSYGVLTWNPDGTYTYIPNSELDSMAIGETFTEVFTVTVSDGDGATVNTSLTITINGANANPVASNDTNSTTETIVITNSDINSSGILLANDTDVDNDTLLVWQVDGDNSGTIIGTYGTLTWNSDGTYTYTPNAELDSLQAGESIVETFTYSCGDGKGGSDDALLTITINGVNADPVLANDTNSTVEINAIDESDGSGNLLSNDTDVDGEILTITSINGDVTGTIVGLYGTFTWNSNGTYSYVPNAELDTLSVGENVQEIYTYTATDGIVDNTATLTITIQGANANPLLIADTNGTILTNVVSEADGSGNLLDNDSDIEGDILYIFSVNGDLSGTVAGLYGTLSWNSNGTYTYTPNAGMDSLTSSDILNEVFTYVANDGNGATASTTLTITIIGDNAPPVLANDTNSTIKANVITETDGSGNLLSNDTDEDSDVLTVIAVNGNNTGTIAGVYGTITWNADGTYTYEPIAAMDTLSAGEFMIDVFTYTVSDGRYTETATLTITINGINTAPLALADDNATIQTETITEADGSGNLLSNDSDVDGDILSISSIEGDNTGNVTGTFGSLVWNSNGTYTYYPNNELDTLVFGESVNEVFIVTVSDGIGGETNTSLIITISGKNDVPALVDDINSTIETNVVDETNGNGRLLGNDYDPEGQQLIITEINGDQSGTATGYYGQLSWNSDGTYVYTPNLEMDSLRLGKNVIDVFTYTAEDVDGLYATAQLLITIYGANSNPVLADDTNSTIELIAVSELDGSGNLLDNDTDPEHDNLIVTTVNGVSSSIIPGTYGTLTWNTDGTYTYTPNSGLDTLALGESVVDTFTYEVSDGKGGSASATLSITINGANQNPVAVNDANVTDEETAITEADGTGNLMANDSDLDGDSIYIQTVNGQSNSVINGVYGTFVWNSNGTYTYTPNPELDSLNTGESLVEEFSIIVADENGGTASSILSIVINGITDNLPPVAATDIVTVDEDSNNNSITVLANDSDPEGDELTITVVQEPTSGGTLAITNNEITYNPPADFFGADTIIYQVCDNGVPTLCDIDTVFVTVLNINDAPVAAEDNNTVNIGSLVTEADGSGNILANDTDVDGDVLTLFSVNGSTSKTINGTYGVLTWNSNGTYTYTPFEIELNSGEVLTETFNYAATDGKGAFANSILTITILPDPRSIDVQAISYCSQNAPYLDYEVSLIDFTDTTGILVNITWYDSNNLIVLNIANQPLSGTILWPGTAVDINGDAIDWPGWIYSGNRWIEGNDGYQNTIVGSVVKFQVSPESSVEAGYPNATIDCILRPEISLVDDYATVSSGNDIDIRILDNDSGVSSEDMVSIINGPDNGTYALNPDGTLNYTSNDNFAGNDTIVYVVTSTLGADTAIVVISVNPYATLTTSTFCEGEVPYYSWNIEAAGTVLTSIDLNIYNANNELIETLVGVELSGSRPWPEVNPLGNTPLLDIPSLLQTISIEIELVVNNDGFTLRSELYAPDCNINTIEAIWDSMTVIGETIIDVLANDYDSDEGDIDTTSLAIYTTLDFVGPFHGDVHVNNDGTITYIPEAGYAGLDSFMYQICDDYFERACDTAVVRLNVLFNDELIAKDDYYSTYRNQPVVYNISANDYDPEGQLDLTSIVILVEPENGTLIVHNNGTVTYQSNETFEGIDQFQYLICDAGIPQDCDSAWVYISVHQNECIAATWDDTITYVNESVVIDVLKNDSDYEEELDSTTLEVISLLNFDGPYHGEATVNNDGTITYVPDALFAGIDSFIYQICDYGYPRCCDTAIVRITVIDNNKEIIANTDLATTSVNEEVTISILANDYDTDGQIDTSSISIVVPPVNGTVQINPVDGTLTYEPNNGFFGQDSIIYQVCDNGPIVKCDTAVVYISISNNLPPVAINDTIDAQWGQNDPHILSINDYDPEGMLDSTSISIVAAPLSGGVFVDTITGIVYYMPDYCANAIDSFTYVIYDAQGLVSNVATVIVNISIDPDADFDMDGISDVNEDLNKDGNPCNDDTDGDGVPNFQDSDDDDDGVLTILEDVENVDGDPTNDDTDGDDIPNYLDNNDDDDCALTIEEDLNGDGNPSNDDTDGDGIPNYLEPDDDGDGLLSCEESEDRDGNNIPDWTEVWNPRANNDVIRIGEEETVVINMMDIMNNDSTQMDSTTFEVILNPNSGSISVDHDNWTITYTPNLGFVGIDSFQYVVCDFYGIQCDTATVYIYVEKVIDVPNIFTPNGDGDNEYLIITNLDRYATNVFTVFNRWGNKVYEQSNYDGEWNGHANVSGVVDKNQPLPVGEYYYILKYGKEGKKVGSIALKR